MSFLTVNTPARSQPITLPEAKAHLRVDADDTEENTLITALVVAACSAVEEDTGRALLTQTWDYAIARPSGCVRLPLAPVVSVSSITYFDTDDAEQSLTVSDFYLFKDNDRAWVKPKSGISWPAMMDRPDALKITFVCGGVTTPQPLKQAALLLVGQWFENRGVEGPSSRPLSKAYDFLIAQHKLGWVA